MIAVKLPIGLSVLSVLGLIVLLARRLPAAWNFPAGVILAAALLFLLVLMQGATYAGIRHALPVVVLLAIFSGLFVEMVLASNSRSLKIVMLAAYFFAGASALPLLRPWEYFNEFVGGARNAHNYFDDEGVDLGQRTKEVADYYGKFLKPSGEVANIIYISSDEEYKGRDLEYLGRDSLRTPLATNSCRWPLNSSLSPPLMVDLPRRCIVVTSPESRIAISRPIKSFCSMRHGRDRYFAGRPRRLMRLAACGW